MPKRETTPIKKQTANVDLKSDGLSGTIGTEPVNINVQSSRFAHDSAYQQESEAPGTPTRANAYGEEAKQLSPEVVRPLTAPAEVQASGAIQLNASEDWPAATSNDLIGRLSNKLKSDV